MELKSGTYLQGDKYRIERSLGQGGFGITYLAEHELAGRMVCIKEFFPKSFYNRDADSSHVSLGSQGSAEMMDAYKQKFLKEARTIARLDHQNIIHIHDVFQENGTAYYVMEYIEGESLQDIVRRRGALPAKEALALMNPVIDAVGYIHDRRIMHLDIKPGNIMVRKEDGRPILIDFGLSKQYDEEGNQTSSTPVGISHGFAPIEQYQMGGVSAFSPQTDIYSLGATLYYLVSGTVPPQAAIIINDGLPALPNTVEENVREAIEKSMQFVSRQRPESIAILKQLLGNKVASAPASAQPSADTVIDIVADNSATQIDGGATQIDVPNDDATQIDGGSETAIEPKPSMATATAPVANAKAVQQPKVQSTSTASSTPAYRSAIQKEPEKKSKWWLWLLLLIVAGVVAVIVLNANSGYGDTYYEDYSYGDTYYESYEYYGEAEIYEEPTTGYHNGYEWVDLGLPSGLKWATCNVGANSPEEYGNYYAWGETSTKSSYTVENSSTFHVDINIDDIAGTDLDAARVNWGGNWRMPRASEIDELLYYCRYEWRNQDGFNGMRFIGPNGNSIFLPAASEYYEYSFRGARGTQGTYLSSTAVDDATIISVGGNQDQFNVSVNELSIWGDGVMSSGESGCGVGWTTRCIGHSVRPVLD